MVLASKPLNYPYKTPLRCDARPWRALTTLRSSLKADWMMDKPLMLGVGKKKKIEKMVYPDWPKGFVLRWGRAKKSAGAGCGVGPHVMITFRKAVSLRYRYRGPCNHGGLRAKKRIDYSHCLHKLFA